MSEAKEAFRQERIRRRRATEEGAEAEAARLAWDRAWEVACRRCCYSSRPHSPEKERVMVEINRSVPPSEWWIRAYDEAVCSV